MKRYYISLAVIALLAVGVVTANLILSRGAMKDQQKISDISDLELAVQTYSDTKYSLPNSLSELTLSGAIKQRLHDYTYQKRNDTTFAICATFATSAETADSSSISSSPYFHKKGYQCFEDTVYSSSSLYPTDYNSGSGGSLYNTPYKSL